MDELFRAKSLDEMAAHLVSLDENQLAAQKLAQIGAIHALTVLLEHSSRDPCRSCEVVARLMLRCLRVAESAVETVAVMKGFRLPNVEVELTGDEG